MVTRNIGTVLVWIVLVVGCAGETAEDHVESGAETIQTNEVETHEKPTLTLREAYADHTSLPFTLNMVDDESFSYFGVVWRDDNGEWNAIYEGEYFTNVLAEHRYVDGELVLTIHTWGEREGTRTPTFVYEVRYPESEFVDDVRVTDGGEVYIVADVVAQYAGELEENS